MPIENNRTRNAIRGESLNAYGWAKMPTPMIVPMKLAVAAAQLRLWIWDTARDFLACCFLVCLGIEYQSITEKVMGSTSYDVQYVYNQYRLLPV